MNIIRQLRIKKGIQQKELALELGISSAAVSNWENGKSDPSGERLRKLAEYFGTDEATILGENLPNPEVPSDPRYDSMSETEKIVQYVLDKIGAAPVGETIHAKTEEAKILARGIDKLPKEQREQALNVVKAMFAEYSEYFEKGSEKDGET